MDSRENFIPKPERVNYEIGNRKQLPPKPERVNRFHNSVGMKTTDTQDALMAQLLLKMTHMAARQTEADLWEFNGTSCLDWPLFKRRFMSICDEGGYSNSQRVAKLDKFVKSPARDLVDIALKTGTTPEPILAA